MGTAGLDNPDADVPIRMLCLPGPPPSTALTPASPPGRQASLYEAGHVLIILCSWAGASFVQEDWQGQGPFEGCVAVVEHANERQAKGMGQGSAQ